MSDYDTDTHVPAASALARSMVESFGQLGLILGHMERYAAEGRSGPDAPPAPLVLLDLLGDVLRRLTEEHGAEDRATAAQMLSSATRIIGDELFIVDMDRLERPGD